jgi:serine/threonine protein kinase
MSYSLVQTIADERIIEKVDGFCELSRNQVLADGFMYEHSANICSLGFKVKVVLTRNAFFVINPKIKGAKAKDMFVKIKVNLDWAVISFAKSSSSNPSRCMPFPFKITFSQDVTSYSLYLVDVSAFAGWLETLQGFGIQNNFNQKYTIEKKIGKGSSANVYRVLSSWNQKFYACKLFCKKKIKRDESYMKAIVNEIRILKDVRDCPGVVDLREVHETNDYVCLIMELIEGPKVFHSNFVNQLDELLPLIKSIIRSLQAVHAKGICHRDLKPDNLLLKFDERPSETNSVVIIDFGLATYSDSDDYIFQQCGTKGYVSPEIMNIKKGDKITPAVDIFSLGVIMYNCVTGLKPLKEIQICQKIFESDREIFDFDNENFQSSNIQCRLISPKADQRYAKV